MHEKPTVMRQREGCAGGGNGPLMSEDKSLTLAANANDQVLFAPVGIDGGDVGYSLRANPSRSGDKGDGGVNCTLAVAGAFNWQSGGDCRGLELKDTAQTLTKEQTPATLHGMAVRRLTPRECERLQGFPDDYTLIPWRGKPADECPDGPRYKALGNSMAVPVMHWIGKRIAQVEAIIR